MQPSLPESLLSYLNYDEHKAFIARFKKHLDGQEESLHPALWQAAVAAAIAVPAPDSLVELLRAHRGTPLPSDFLATLWTKCAFPPPRFQTKIIQKLLIRHLRASPQQVDPMTMTSWMMRTQDELLDRGQAPLNSWFKQSDQWSALCTAWSASPKAQEHLARSLVPSGPQLELSVVTQDRLRQLAQALPPAALAQWERTLVRHLAQAYRQTREVPRQSQQPWAQWYRLLTTTHASAFWAQWMGDLARLPLRLASLPPADAATVHDDWQQTLYRLEKMPVPTGWVWTPATARAWGRQVGTWLADPAREEVFQNRLVALWRRVENQFSRWGLATPETDQAFDEGLLSTAGAASKRPCLDESLLAEWESHRLSRLSQDPPVATNRARARL